MYVEAASSSSRGPSPAGTIAYPTRRPGAIVSEKDELYITSCPLELEQARQGLALEADGPVRVVFHDGQRAIAGELRQPPASLLGQRRAGRVLKGRNRVHKRRLRPARNHPLELIDVEAVVVHPHLVEVLAPAAGRIFLGRS